MENLSKLQEEFHQLLTNNTAPQNALDYSIFDNQVPVLKQIAELNGSGLTVFDIYQKKHILNWNLESLFGYDLEMIEKHDSDYYNSRIHPEDLVNLVKIGIYSLRKFYEVKPREKSNYKLQNEYRILNAKNNYTRIIEQFQILELDKNKNLWLTVSFLDISPNQDPYDGVRSQLVNFETGEMNVICPEKLMKENDGNSKLSKRESQILNFVKDGFLSKEISEKLSISVHTVNTHRQNILKNSMPIIQWKQWNTPKNCD